MYTHGKMNNIRDVSLLQGAQRRRPATPLRIRRCGKVKTVIFCV